MNNNVINKKRKYFKFIIVINVKYFLFLGISSILLSINTTAAKLFIISTCIGMIFNTQIRNTYLNIFSKHMSIFATIKLYSVFITVALYTFNNIFKIPSHIFSYMLAINILEPAFLLEFITKEPLKIINGILLIICALLTPIMSTHNNVIGFTNLTWIISCSVFLTQTYLFNKFFDNDHWRFSVIAALWIPTTFSFLTNNTQLYIRLRGFALLMIFYTACLSYKTLKRVENIVRPNKKNEYISTIIGSVCVCLLLKQGIDNTVLQKIIKNFY
jgi:hypothetical protein